MLSPISSIVTGNPATMVQVTSLCVSLLLQVLVATLSVEAVDRFKRRTTNGTCVDCKINFNTERSAASSPNERCQALKNYITCRTYTSTSWDGCSLSFEDGQSIRQYYDSIETTCMLSDTCECQMTRWKNTDAYYKGKTYKNYMSCLYSCIMPACDGVTEPVSLIDTALYFMSDFLKTKEDCDKEYHDNTRWGSSDQKCRYIQMYLSCLGDIAANGQGYPLNETEIEELQTKLDDAEFCEISLTDTCQCQKAYMVNTSSDICSASKQYAACTNNSFMSGCKQDEYPQDVRDTAELLKRQNCPNDPEYSCSGYEMCHIDMAVISRETEELRQESCSLLRSYIQCLEDSAPTVCAAVNGTIEHLRKIMDYKLWCPPDLSDYPTSYPPTYPPVYPSTYSTADPSASTTAYPSAYTTAYPSFSTSAFPSPFPTGYPTTSPTKSTVSYLSKDKTLLLMSNIESAKMEAEENLHAAQEALDAINTAKKMMEM